MDVVTAFVDLAKANAGHDFPALKLSHHRMDFLAKLSDGSPAVLLHDASHPVHVPSIEYQHIDIQFHCTCRATTDEESVEAQFAMIHCSAVVPELHELFIRAVASATAALPAVCDTGKLQQVLRSLLDLFRSLSGPADRDIIGLWGELFVIALSRDVVRALEAWRANPFDKHDFSSECGSLEVKATARATRIHAFSLSQLSELPTMRGFVASLLLQSSGGGTGIIDLARQIDARARLHPALTSKLWRNVAKALGSDFSERLDRRFSYAYAERNLVIYAFSDVPTPPIPDDPRITEVSFVVDLTSVDTSLNDEIGKHLDFLVL